MLLALILLAFSLQGILYSRSLEHLLGSFSGLMLPTGSSIVWLLICRRHHPNRDVLMSLCVCVSVNERERQRETKTERDGEREIQREKVIKIISFTFPLFPFCFSIMGLNGCWSVQSLRCFQNVTSVLSK